MVLLGSEFHIAPFGKLRCVGLRHVFEYRDTKITPAKRTRTLIVNTPGEPIVYTNELSLSCCSSAMANALRIDVRLDLGLEQSDRTRT